jgi:hypothetical protein
VSPSLGRSRQSAFELSPPAGARRPRATPILIAACLSALLSPARTTSAAALDDPALDAGAPAPADTEENFDNRWVTASSDHFVIYAQGGVRVARRALDEAERAIEAVRLALTINGQFPDDRRPLTLVVFAYGDGYAMVAPSRTNGLFRPAIDWGETDMVLLRAVGRFAVLRHELVHRVTQPMLPKAPPWLSEGMAQYFQWLEASDDSIVFGSTPDTVAAQRLVHESVFDPPLSEVLATPRSEFYGQRALGFYNASFWLVSTLNSDANHRQRLNRFIQSLAKGLPPERAWEGAFSGSDLEALERDYRASRSRPDPVSHRLAWKPAAARITVPRPRRRPDAPRAAAIAPG